VYDAIRNVQTLEVDINVDKFWRGLLRHPFRHVPSALVLSTGCYLLLGLWNPTTSTYICPLTGVHFTIIVIIQVAAVVLDSVVAIAVVEMSLPSFQAVLPQKLKGSAIWASALIITVLIWFIIGVVVYVAVPDDLSERIPFHVINSVDFISSQVNQALQLSILCIGAIISVS
jgi:hypothetical protein